MNKLEEICEKKRIYVEAQKAKRPLSELNSILKDRPPPRGFKDRLHHRSDDGQTALIAEVKKASPSKGVIREDFDPVQIARIYEDNGASCLSVLTDEPYFQGCDAYFTAIREQIALPMLRKDFMVDPYQITESRTLGADCVLLIVAALDDSQLQDMYDIAIDLGMDVLVETHDAQEIEQAIHLKKAMIGVNNRNLKTLDVSLDTGIALAERIPDHFFKIAESGIRTAQDISTLKASGYKAFLIGEHLMQQENIAQAVENILINIDTKQEPM